jgi:hypothetical protein
MKNKYFFCYSPTLHKFIHNKYKIRYICAAKNEQDRKFWLYEQSEILGKALNEYNQLFKGGDSN